MSLAKNDLSVISLQILVILVEQAYSQQDGKSTGAAELFKKLYFGLGTDLLSLMLRMCINFPIEKTFSMSELRLIARLFASMPPLLLKEKDIGIFNSGKSKAEVCLINIMQALANILQAGSEEQTAYFVIFTTMNLVGLLPLKTVQATNQPKLLTKYDEKLEHMSMSELDF